MKIRYLISTPIIVAAISGCAAANRSWLAGDHHIHSQFSVGWTETDPPRPILGADAIYAIPKNAEMARHFDLDWMVATDHGGPTHSKVNLEMAYPELLQSREQVPEVIQFFGLELNSPGADHSSIIMPHTQDEAQHLHEYESRFDKREPWPADAFRDNERLMLEALEFAEGLPVKPVVIAHHPSRSAPGPGEYGLTTPRELRAWNDRAPEVAVGMEGAPGHQAASISKPEFFGDNLQAVAMVRARGAYGRGYPTHGGFDQMTAIVGGFWDSMLGEGRRWWITANSDSHIHYTQGGIDFWPGEYSKTYVFAEKNHNDILEGIRHGRIFVTLGDLVSELYVTASASGKQADIGGELLVDTDETVTVTIRVRDPETKNAAGDNPRVNRVDLIVGEVTGAVDNPAINHHHSAEVVSRFSSENWQADGEYLEMQYEVQAQRPFYLRIRGTNSNQLEPEADARGEDPWEDLWFYSNPIFVSTR